MKPSAVPERASAPARRAVLYARVSSKEQEKEGFSIPSQRKLLQAYAAAHALQIEREFIEIETAKKAGRAAFTEMLAYLRKHAPDCRVLLVEKTDRLYRNIRDWVTLDEADLEIHLVKEAQVLSNDSRSSDKFVHGIKVLVAKNFIDNLSEESRKGMREKAEEGIWPSQAPLGYLNVVGPHGKKHIVPDPATAPLVTRLFEQYAAGRISLTEITRRAREDGLRSKKGNPVPKATIHNVLRNTLYMGEYEWDDRRFTGVHTPLVSRELWDRVQAVLDHRFDTRHRKAIHDFAFARLIQCGHCGCSLVGDIKKGRYIYYRCTGYKGRCPEPYVREEVFEDRFAAALEALTFDDEIFTWLAGALRERRDDERAFHAATLERLRAEHERLQRRLDEAYTDKLDGRIDAAAFDRLAARWRGEQDALTRTMAEHRVADETPADDAVRLLELAKRAANLYRTQPAREKRRLLDFVLSNSTWADDTLAVTYRQPFDVLARTVAATRNDNAAEVSQGGVHPEWLRMRSHSRTLSG